MQGPPATTPGWVAASLAFWGLFLIVYLLSTFHHRLGPKLSGWLSKPVVTRSAAWTGFLSYMIGEWYKGMYFVLVNILIIGMFRINCLPH